jgi:Cupin domain
MGSGSSPNVRASIGTEPTPGCARLTSFGGWCDGVVETMAIRGVHRHDGSGTLFVVSASAATVTVGTQGFRIPPLGYGVLPREGSVTAAQGLAIVHRGHVGLFMVGGPVENRGRLRYIDGCSDTVLVAPVTRGDPCLNLLHLPSHVVQTDHEHPSLRVGLVLRGTGQCVIEGQEPCELSTGTVFTLPAGTIHRFETEQTELLIVAWHPDSDFGPTDDDHPMLNRTLAAGTDRRIR